MSVIACFGLSKTIFHHNMKINKYKHFSFLIQDSKISNCSSKTTQNQWQRLNYLTIQDKDNSKNDAKRAAKGQSREVKQRLVTSHIRKLNKMTKQNEVKTKPNSILTSSCSDSQRGVGAKYSPRPTCALIEVDGKMKRASRPAMTPRTAAEWPVAH